MQYLGCLSFDELCGDQFGAPIGLSISSPPGYPLTAESGFSYVPEPDATEDCELASLAVGLVAITRTRRSRQ